MSVNLLRIFKPCSAGANFKWMDIIRKIIEIVKTNKWQKIDSNFFDFRFIKEMECEIYEAFIFSKFNIIFDCGRKL